MTGPPAEREVAIHEAGHAVMAYLLGAAFAEISVIKDDDSRGRVSHTPPRGDWLHPDIEVNNRVRNYLERHIMITLAGAETQAAWWRRQSAAPDDLDEQINAGANSDMNAAIDLGSYVCGGSIGELEAYIEWLRQRVLTMTGRPLSEGEQKSKLPPFQVKRITEGDARFWVLVDALAAAVLGAGTLRWRKAREVLRAADPILLELSARQSQWQVQDQP